MIIGPQSLVADHDGSVISHNIIPATVILKRFVKFEGSQMHDPAFQLKIFKCTE